MKTFLIIWLGQLVSMLGSSLTGFALGVWVFEQTGSATQFALVLLATSLPRVLLSPFAGVVADRWDRRRLIMLSDFGAGLGTFALFLVFNEQTLQVWHIYVATALSSCFTTFQGPALGASVTMLVRDEQLERANGLQQFSQALAQLLGPLLGGWLLTLAGLQTVLLLDCFSFIIAVGSLLFTTIPMPENSPEHEGIWLALSNAAHYLRKRRELSTLMLYFGIINLTSAMALALLTPLILSFTETDTLGVLLSLGGLGLVVGSLVMSVWRGPKPINGVFGFMILFCPFVTLIGLRPLPWLVGLGIFGAYFTLPFVNGYTAVIFQREVAPQMQGRVFALTQLIGGAAMPLGYLTAGSLADWLEPLLLPGGLLAGSLGQLVGVGVGRGTGLIFVAIAVFTLVVTGIFYMQPALKPLKTMTRRDT